MKQPFFLVIDDDPLSNYITKHKIKEMLAENEVVAITDPVKGIAYLNDFYVTEKRQECTLLLLDINMPVLNGWEVLECIEKLSESVKKMIRIFMFSSSVASEDRLKANDNPIVAGFIEKPMTDEKLQSVLADQNLQ